LYCDKDSDKYLDWIKNISKKTGYFAKNKKAMFERKRNIEKYIKYQ